MRKNLARGIACVVAFVNVAGLSPAQDYESGKIAGMARLERELDRATLERDKDAWKAISAAGISLAMAEWEARTLSLRDADPVGWRFERDKTSVVFDVVSREEYAEWLSEGFFGERGIARGRQFADELARRAAEWKYADGDGSAGRIISTADASDARAQWRKSVSTPIIDEYLLAWERDNGETVLRAALSEAGASPEEIEKAVGSGFERAYASARGEYARVAAIEENRLIASFLYDANSLRKDSESRAASAIADRLADATRAETDSEMNRVLDSLDESFEGGERAGIEIDPDSWMSSFRSSMENAMAKWEAAESDFLVRRAEWERDSQRVYLDGEQSWADAFASLRLERDEWQREMLKRFEEGSAKWENRERELSGMLRNARDEFEAVCAEETRKTTDLIDLEITIYDQSRSMIETSVLAMDGWYEQWGERYSEVYAFWKSSAGSYCPSGPLVRADSPPADGDTERLLARVGEWKTAARDMLQRQLTMEFDRKKTTLSAVSQMLRDCERDRESLIERRKLIDGRATNYDELCEKIAEQIESLEGQIPIYRNLMVKLEGELEATTGYSEVFRGLDCETTKGSEIDSLVMELREKFSIDEQNLSDIGAAWDASDGLIRWSRMVDAYRKKADGASTKLFEIAGSVAGPSSGQTYFDELHMESLKAKAISRHWADELAVAEAVNAYASDKSASAEWAKETLENLSLARTAYELAVSEYDAEVSKLDELLADSDNSASALETARAALSAAGDAVQSARNALSDATLALKGIGLEGLREKVSALAASLTDAWSACESGESGEASAALEYYRYARANAQASADTIVARLVFGLINGGDGPNSSNLGLAEMRLREARASALASDESEAQYAALGEIPEEYASLRGILSSQYAILASNTSIDAERDVARSILRDSWKVVSAYWGDKIREREACVSYLGTGRTGYEEADPESSVSRQKRVDAWLAVQHRLINDELSIAVSRPETRDSLSRAAILRGLIANIESVNRLDSGAKRVKEIERLRSESPAFASLMRGESTFEGSCPEWSSYLYRLETSDDSARRAQTHRNAVSLYSGFLPSVLNESHQSSLDSVNSIIANADVDTLRLLDVNGDPEGGEGSLLAYIEGLEAAGKGLSSTAGEALGNYIRGVVEHAAERCLNEGETGDFGGMESVAALLSAHGNAANERAEFGLAIEGFRDLTGALRIASSEAFVGRATRNEKQKLGEYLAALLIGELPNGELETCADRASLAEILSSRANCVLDADIVDGTWAAIDNALGEREFDVGNSEILAEWFRLGTDDPARKSQRYTIDPRIKACLDGENLLSLLRDCSDEDDELALRRYAVREGLGDTLDAILAADASERVKPYAAYAFGGADTLYYYVLEVCPADWLHDALESLGRANSLYAKSARECRNVVDTVKAYSALVDGPIDGWLAERRGIDGNPLTDPERERIAKSIASGSSLGLSALIEESRLRAKECLDRVYDRLALRERSAYWLAQFAAETARAIASDDIGLMREAGIGVDDGDRERHSLAVTKARLEIHSGYLASEDCANELLSYGSASEDDDPDRRAMETRELARSAWSIYARFRTEEQGIRQAIRQNLSRIRAFSGSIDDIKARLLEAENGVIHAESDYESAVIAVNAAGSRAQKAFDAYNGQVDAINAKYEIAEDKKLELLKAQGIHDWASSVYLADSAPSLDSSYETPREALTRARYAANAARIASEVLDELEASNLESNGSGYDVDPSYASAFDDYEASARRYYLARAVRYEAELRIESVRQLVRDAESEERAALERIAMDDVTLDSRVWSSLEFIGLSRDAETGRYELCFDEGNVDSVDREAVNAYFGDKTESIQGVDGIVYRSRATSEAIEWLTSVEQREDSEEYLASLGLALLYAKTLAAGTNAAYACLFDDGTGTEVPFIENNGLWAEPFAMTIHDEDIADFYRLGRVKAIKQAYDSVMADDRARIDLARYALYRDTVFKRLRFAESEKAQLESRAMSHVQSSLDGVIQGAFTLGVLFASEAAVLAIPAVFCPYLWAAVALNGALSATNFDKANSLSGVRSDVERNKSSKSAYATAIRDDWDGDFAAWRDKTALLKARQDELAACVASTDPSGADRLTYHDFVAGFDSLFSFGKSEVSREDATLAYSESAFNSSGANAASNAYEARALIEAYYLKDLEQKRNALDGMAISLVHDQLDGLAEFEALRSTTMEIPQDVKDRLRDLARLACDRDTSVAARRDAQSEYERLSALVEAESSFGEYRNALESIAADSFGSGSWIKRYRDNRLNRLYLALSSDNATYGRSIEPYVRENLAGLRESLIASVANAQSTRRAAKENEWELAELSLSEDREAWNRQYSLIKKRSDAAWGSADLRVAEEYANWRNSVKIAYDQRSKEWSSGYDAFLGEMQDWLDEQYVYAANVMGASVLTNTGTNVDAAIASATRKTLQGEKSALKGSFDSSKYVDRILGDTDLSHMMDYARCLADGANTRVESLRKYTALAFNADADISAAMMSVGEISNDMSNASAALAARQARALMRGAHESFALRLDGENEAMRDWERDLALNAGYTMGADISRSAIVDATAMNNVRERQTLHRYEDFTVGDASVSIDFDGSGLENLGGNAIMLALAKAQDEFASYAESIFGKTDKAGAVKRWQIPRTRQEAAASEYSSIESDPTTTSLLDELLSLTDRDYDTLSDAEKEELSERLNSVVSVRDGSFGRHVGFAPLFKSGADLDLSKSRDENLKFGGMGELGKIILEFQWNSMMEGKGYAELSRPVYDKRLWDDRGMPFKAPTARAVIDLAMNVVSMACGNNPLIGLIDDGLFAMVDYAGGYKSIDQLATELGSKAIGTAISLGIGWGGAQLTGLASGFSEAGKVALSAGVAGVSSAATTITTEFLSEIDITKIGTSEWFDSEGFASSMTDPRTWASAVGSAVGAGLSGGLSLCVGDANSKFFGGAIDLAGSVGGEAARFGVYAASALSRGGTLAEAFDEMGGISINLLDFGGMVDLLGTAIASGNATGQTRLSALAGRTGGAGLLELHIGTNGMYAQFGSNGVNVGGSLYRLTKGLSDKTILSDYAAEHKEDGKGEAALNAYVYGDWSSETTARRIALGKDELEFVDAVESGSAAKTTQSGSGRHIEISDSGNSLNNAVALQHESHRDGIVSEGNESETADSVIAHARMASEMKKRGLALDLDGLLALEVALYDKGDFKTLSEIADKKYDSSEDYWKVTKNGNLAYDGKANVYDANGILIKATKSQGVEGSMLEILGLDDNDENRAAVVAMMRSSGLEQDVNGNWRGSDVSIDRKIPYSSTNGNYIAKHVDLTALNMGKEVSLYAIDSCLSGIGVDKNTYQRFIENNYISAHNFSALTRNQSDNRWSTSIYEKAYSSDERAKIQANSTLLQSIENQGIDYSNVSPGAVRTTAFGEAVNVTLATSSVAGAVSFSEEHTGFDYGSGGSGVYTPGGYWKVIKTEDHKVYLQLLGSDVKMRIMHLDPNKVDDLSIGKIIGSAQGSVKIIDYPTISYGSGSGAHTHFDFTRSIAGNSSYYRSFVNPSNWSNGNQIDYQYTYFGANNSPLPGYPRNFYRY